MEAWGVLGMFFYIMIILCLLTLTGFFMYWTAKFLIVLPKCLLRITVALEKIANKK